MSHSELPARDPARAVTTSAPLPNGQALRIHACWNEIGMHGDGSCPELQKFVRCRNCPVYASAGERLLDRPAPPGYRREWGEHYAKDKQPASPYSTSALIFRIQAEWLALPTEVFQEVAEKRPVHSLPHRQDGVVLGLVNVRGELLICVSLGHWLGLDNPMPHQTWRKVQHRLLVAHWGGNRLVFPVSEVCGINRFDPQQLQEPPATLARSNLRFSRGILKWEERSVGLLDPGVLFPSLNRSLS